LDIDWSPLEESIKGMNYSAIYLNQEIEEYNNWEKGKTLKEIFTKTYLLRNINDRLMKVDQTLLTDQTIMTGNLFY
jgi:hypothetical protein